MTNKLTDDANSGIGIFKCKNKLIYIIYIFVNLLYIFVYAVTFVNFNKQSPNKYNDVALNMMLGCAYLLSAITNYLIFKDNNNKKVLLLILFVNIIVSIIFFVKNFVNVSIDLNKLAIYLYTSNIILYSFAYLYYSSK